MLFAALFGLSMDYEVFIVSRIAEEQARTGKARESVTFGTGRASRLVCAAGAIMFFVFASFVLVDDVLVKMFGVGLAAAIVIDVVITRMVCVPAAMALLGRASWWLPKWLAAILPRVPHEGDVAEQSRFDPMPTPDAGDRTTR